MKSFTRTAIAAALAVTAVAASAQTKVTDAWVRGTVPQQTGTGLFAKLTSTQGGKLVAAESPAAALVEVHEMVMEDNIAKMRGVESVELPPGKTVELKPGSYHVMLLDLTKPLKAGDKVPVTFIVEGRDGKQESITAEATVRPLGKTDDKSAAGETDDLPEDHHGHKH